MSIRACAAIGAMLPRLVPLAATTRVDDNIPLKALGDNNNDCEYWLGVPAFSSETRSLTKIIEYYNGL